MTTKELYYYINNHTNCIGNYGNYYTFTDGKGQVFKFNDSFPYVEIQNSTGNWKPINNNVKNFHYPTVNIYINKMQIEPISTHILVAMVVHFNAYQQLIAFANGSTIDVCHKNNDKTDYSFNNLEWGTREQNIAHSKMVTALSKVTGKNVLLETVRYGSKSYYRLINKKIENIDLENFYNANNEIKQRVVIEKRALRQRDAKAFIDYMGWK